MAKRKKFSDYKNFLTGVSSESDEVNHSDETGTEPLPAIQAAISDVGSVKKSRTLIQANVDLCVPWKYADRHSSQINDESCKELIDDIRKNGQEVPAIARKIANPTDDKEYEIISGRRRLHACSKTKDRQILLDVRAIDDQQAAKIMVKENENRKDISEFERAISLVQQLEAGLWDTIENMRRNYEDLDNKLYSSSNFSKILTAGRLYKCEQIMAIIPSIAQIKIKPAYELVCFLEKDKQTKEVILKRAWKLKEKISVGTELKTPQIIRDLLNCVQNSNKTEIPKVTSIAVGPIEKAIEIKQGSKQITLKIDKQSLQPDLKNILIKELEKAL